MLHCPPYIPEVPDLSPVGTPTISLALMILRRPPDSCPYTVCKQATIATFQLLLTSNQPSHIRFNVVRASDRVYKIMYIYIHSLVFSLEGRAWQEPEPSHVTGMALAHCILGKFLGVVCHCFPPPLDVPTLTGASVRNDARDPSSERWNCGRKRCPVVILPKFRLPHIFRDLLHAANL